MLWYYCDNETGAILTGGLSPNEETAKKNSELTPEGAGFYMVPDGSVSNMFEGTPDFSVLQNDLCNRIDREAGELRALFITDVPGQPQTYERKEREARAWTPESDPANFPFMTAEADERGIDIAVVQAEIMQQVETLIPLAARVEGRRIATKERIMKSTTLPGIISAYKVDWSFDTPSS